MKYKLEDVRFTTDADLAERVQVWIEAQDSTVSVRRVFYAMVKDRAIENLQEQYARISRIVLKLRRGGRLDWNRIADTTRGSYKSASFDSAATCAASALKGFRLDRWSDQDWHVEVWTEKRGHVAVLYPTTDELDVLIVEDGGKRAITEDTVETLLAAQDAGKSNVIVYVGDYDPSGLRMDKNMKEQLEQWNVAAEWIRVALTLKQIRQYDIPRAYVVKDTASDAWLRAHADVEILGRNSDGRPLVNKLEKDTNAKWFRGLNDGELFQVEVDALDAPVLRKLVRSAIERYLDADKYRAKLADEQADREGVEAILEGR